MQSQFKFILFLFTAIITNILVLELLRINVVNNALSSFFLGSAYLLCSFFLLFRNKNFFKDMNKFYVLPALWGVVMGVIIVYFYDKSDALNVSDVLIAQAISPTLGLLLITGVPPNLDMKKILLSNTPFVFLVLIVSLKVKSLKIEQSLFLLILMFTLAQVFLRLTSKKVPTYYSYIVSGFFIFLITSTKFVFQKESLRIDIVNFLVIVFCAIGVYVIQKGYVEGVRNLPNSLSNLLISSGIPISIIYTYILNEASLSLLVLSILYIISVFYIKVIRQL